MILSLSCFSLAVALYAISQLQQQSKLRGQKGDASFWGEKSWTRKWKTNTGKQLTGILVIHTKEERFPLSSTLLVFLTDGYHLMQFFFTILFCISVVSYEREFGFWWDLLVYYTVWHCIFPITYKIFSK